LIVNLLDCASVPIMLRFSKLMLHHLLLVWFGWVENWGYTGVFILMAMESSIIPVPSEIVMPPAAFWAAQGRMSFSGVILAGTAGSYFGSLLNYWISRWLGLPIVHRYGKYFLLPTNKLELAELWVQRFGNFGIFTARLLPVVRHLISIPAGLFRMPFLPFSIWTVLGAGIWCTVLSWFGRDVIGNNPELLHSPESMMKVIKGEMHWILAAVGLLIFLYIGLIYFKKTQEQKRISR
jgi:membrane protein DedA with SNARE-associated domain